MNTPRRTRYIFLALGGLLLLCVCVVVGGLVAFSLIGPRVGLNPPAQAPLRRGPFNMPMNPFGRRPAAPVPTGTAYASNGQQIYFTGTSQSGSPILPEMQGMRMMPPGHLACASCHGPDGRGGKVSMMMSTFSAPDIRWSVLSQEGYTTDTLKRAISEGLDESGDALEWQMPRWRMSAGDMNDLVNYLQTLQ